MFAIKSKEYLKELIKPKAQAMIDFFYNYGAIPTNDFTRENLIFIIENPDGGLSDPKICSEIDIKKDQLFFSLIKEDLNNCENLSDDEPKTIFYYFSFDCIVKRGHLRINKEDLGDYQRLNIGDWLGYYICFDGFEMQYSFTDNAMVYNVLIHDSICRDALYLFYDVYRPI